ncbi:hypothetical protein ABPG75_008759 [Micractinium tetrahymenae]
MQQRSMPSLPQQDARVLSAAGAGRDDLLEEALAAGGSPNARDFCGDPALLLAARGGGSSLHIACCRRLLAAGADPAAQGSRGETAVMVAVQTGSEQLLEAVLVKGVDLGARSDGGLTALQLACLHRRPGMLARLIQHLHAQLDNGAAPAGSTGDGPAAEAPAEGTAERRQQTAEQTAGWQLVLAAFAAVAAGEPRCLQQLVSDPLARAAYASQFGWCTACNAAGGVSSSGEDGGHGGSGQASGGAPGSTPGNPPRPGAWRHDRAAEERLQEELSFLLDPGLVGARNSRPASFLWQTNGMPSHLAAAMDQPECLHILLSSGFCCTDERTSDGFTPLMLAAAADATAAAAVLLQHGAALEARNSATRTPAFLAAVSGGAGVLALLIRAGADVSAAEETRGCPPLTAALGRAAYLCSGTGAALARPEAGAAAESAAAPFLRCAQLLLEAGASPLQASKDGGTAVHAAAEGGFLPGLQLLLGWAASKDSSHSSNGRDIMDVDSAASTSAVASLLGAEDAAGRTPLARAAAAGRAAHCDCILFLMSRGAAVGSPDLASKILDCLLRSGSTSADSVSPGASGGSIVSVWQLLARLNAAQLKALTACPRFYDLPHSEAPEQPLPPAALDAMLQLAAEGCSNLLYNVSPADSTTHGRRPAYLFELLRRHATEAGFAAGVALSRAVAAGLREAVADSLHVAKLLRMWASVQMLLQHACCLARCRGVPPSDREQLSVRVGHLLSAYHALAGLCSALDLSLSAGVEHPHAPLAASSAAALGPLRSLALAPLTPAPSLEPVGAAALGAVATALAGPASGDGGSAEGGTIEDRAGPAAEQASVKNDGAGTSRSPSPSLDERTMLVDPAAPAPAAAAPAAAAATVYLQAAATDGPSSPVPPRLPATAAAAQQPQAEPALAAALRPFGDALHELVAAVADQAQLRAWLFLLEYKQVAGLGCRQRLLQSLIAAWPRRNDSQLSLSTGRQGVLQRVCSEVDEREAAGGASMAGALWHGLKVAFDQENGAGDGVRREWFRLLAAELTNPDTGLFESHNGGASFAPAPHASMQREPWEQEGAFLRKFELVGRMIGVGLLQGCTLPGLALTHATWHALLGQPPQPETDLAEADPLLCRNLQLLRGLAPAELGGLALHFEAHDALGRGAELCPGGAGLQVTAGNLERYIALLARHKVVDGPARAAGALARGMRGVLTAGVLDMLGRCFDHAELNALVAGLAELELPAWQAATRYEGCSPATPQVGWLWAALARADAPLRARLLSFVTGSASLPAGGFAALHGFNGSLHPFTVCLVPTEGDDRLPRASTCFNTLFLPAYSSAVVLEARLLQAITGEQSFDEAVIRR